MNNANTSEHAQEANTKQERPLEQMSTPEIIEEMMEEVCDHICRFPYEMNQEELANQCFRCKLEQYAKAIKEKGGNTNGMV